MCFYGKEIGPFGMMDRIGLDVVLDIENVYFEESGEEFDRPPRLLVEKVERGELGVKTGKGFYTYPARARLFHFNRIHSPLSATFMPEASTAIVTGLSGSRWGSSFGSSLLTRRHVVE